MKLFIVESPAKSKTISKYLEGEYKVTSSVGHFRDIPKSSKDAIDIEAGFVPNYQIVPGKERVASELKSLCAKADEVILATDPDREGEAIAWHIAQICNLGNSKPQTLNSKQTGKSEIQNSKLKRIVFHEVTKPAILEALAHPRDIDDNLRKAQEARRVLDRLFGYDLSALIWKKVRYGLSAGRVQSPALRILMERERKIRAFRPKDYWVITAHTETKGKNPLVLACTEEPDKEAEAVRIVAEGKKGVWRVKDIEETNVRRAAPAPFTTSTLQQAASNRLGMAPAQTMRAAQGLYEAGHITYMRTDSTVLSATAQKEIASFVVGEYGTEYSTPRVHKTKSKSAQEAHEAVRPTHVGKKTVGGTPEQKRLYDLIWRRAIASQMADAAIARTKIIATTEAGGIPDFAAHGARTEFFGWLKADPDAKSDDVELPKVIKDEPLTLTDISSEKKQTEPPKRYTEAGLIKELEKRGIGRPSTYASIMKTLVDRAYVLRENRTLHPTELGDVVDTFLEENFADYISDSFTSEMEDDLDQIAEGKKDYVKLLKDFYGPFSKYVKEKTKTIGKLTNIGKAPANMRCPKCGSAMVIKLSRAGTFLSCERFPECDGARTMEGESFDTKKELKETGEKCPECGDSLPAGRQGKLVEREGKFGKFVGCSNYPKCKFIKKGAESEEAKRAADTGVVCPECKKGTLAERKGRFGVFYSCTNYPKCKFAIKAKPTGKLCQECGSLMMEGTKTIPERCSKKECLNHNPHKLLKK
ncbi:MAG: DNA topoisomerase I [Candidatus Lloydbacteria bacterium RIFCSPLOWO2_12_FULL_51_9]|uniref:DNA topoisomerase 1 n=1 Tax=Candidatus Lloydbacteria bacterium RIFCSPLOWO2_12_FULL_51_9 TaxID=1798669 RepID=A0A1G2DU70_9BACT|nr:MAG: DNA topoisomerase I [Candidatus Lloydbacteria bacterium RIFCSPLOWO2_12_FULL_51_9]